ncbi:hypothetical protein P389DRAFT_108096 [Cystobasidium minutum MCA 4210]|uniref:uncharacterized protein n=1 Tax=Cystobasidium minutum MCA 4210 TaxID=1397322 RepID=UPI0034CD2C5B|eukprot:jgi/Rhomi1/108096/CE108095_104
MLDIRLGLGSVRLARWSLPSALILSQLCNTYVIAGSESASGKASKASDKDNSFKFQDLKFDDTDVQLGLVVFCLLVVTVIISIAMMVMCCMMRNRNQHREKLEAKIEALEAQVIAVSKAGRIENNEEWEEESSISATGSQSPSIDEKSVESKRPVPTRSASESGAIGRQTRQPTQADERLAYTAPDPALHVAYSSTRSEHYPFPESIAFQQRQMAFHEDAERSMSAHRYPLAEAMPSLPPQQVPLPESLPPKNYPLPQHLESQDSSLGSSAYFPPEEYGTAPSYQPGRSLPADPGAEQHGNENQPRLANLVNMAMLHKKEVLKYRPWMADELVDSPRAGSPVPEPMAK